MNYGWLKPGTSQAEYRRVVLHEFGHVLGLLHEHLHTDAAIPWDRERVYEEYAGPPNYFRREDVDVNVFQRLDRGLLRESAFDRASIMLYPIPVRLTDGKFSIGWNRDLSAGDKAFVAKLYPGR